MTEWFEQWFGEEYHTRRISEDGRFVVKEIELRDEDRSFKERVRLFRAAELAELLEQEGLRVEACFGDYDGMALDGDSPRAILVGIRGQP